MMGYGWNMGVDGWMWMIGCLVLLIGIVLLVALAMRGSNRSADGRADTSARADPIAILRERFARGEITEAAFEQAKRALGDGR